MDIVFVNMPIAEIQRPSIALGLLQSILGKAGMDVHVAYANLWFAEYIGLDSYLQVQNSRTQDVLGDWLFAEAAFPGHRVDTEAYVRHLLLASRSLANQPEGDAIFALAALRDHASRFVSEAADRIVAMGPRIVGCTSMFQQNVASLAVLRLIRERAPHIVTMMGGANCETVMGQTLHRHFDWVDYVVSGEADGLIVDLCEKALRRGREMSLAEVPFGVMAPVHRSAGYPVSPAGDGVPRAVVHDLRSVPPPRYDDYFGELDGFVFKRSVFPTLPIETSRGCWWGAKSHCTFCGLNGHGMNYRSKPAAQARMDIEVLVDRYKVKRIQAVDNILDSRYVGELLPGLAEREEKLSIFFEVKSNLKKQHIELFRRAGIRLIQPGIESLDTRVLQLMKKGCAAWQNILLLKWCRQFGISVAWTIIHGFPGEKDEWHADVAAILPALHHLQVGGFNPLRYDRYSPYFTRPLEWGLSLVASPSYRYVYPLDESAIGQIAYFFEDVSGRRDVLAHRPGLESLREAHTAWRESARPAASPWRLPTLELDRLATGGAVVTDTRACAREQRGLLDPFELAVLDACDGAPSIASVSRQVVAAHGGSEEDVLRVIDMLSYRRWILRVDGRAVGLVLEAPVAGSTWLPLREQPVGSVRLRRTRGNADPLNDLFGEGTITPSRHPTLPLAR